MVQLLILYYLSLKSTHGYEIQKFIQLNHMEEWNSIQSGSIYYAMGKLEKDGLIKLVDKVGDNEKARKIYEITDEGRSNLAQMALHELKKPLGDTSSEKFLLYPIMANLTRQEMLTAIEEHIVCLKKQLCDINDWYQKKHKTAENVEKATFKLMKSTVENQIEWHKALAEHLDETISLSKKVSNLIKKVDFSILNE